MVFNLFKHPVIFVSLLVFASAPLKAAPSSETASPPICESLSTEERIPALGFELGLCRDKVLVQIKDLSKTVNPNNPESVYTNLNNRLILNYVSHRPPQSPDLNFFTTLYFKEDKLAAVHANYVYSDSSKAVRTYRYFNKTLSLDFGRGTESAEFIQTNWENEDMIITLILEPGDVNTLRVSVKHKLFY